MKKIILIASLLIAAAPAAYGEVNAKYRDWAAGPVSFFFTEAERTAWAAVASDEDAEMFARLFWARRDPTPDTPENEYRAEIEQRVAYADKQFATEEERGSMTDRGHTFAVFGPPRKVIRPNSEGTAAGGDIGIGSQGGGGVSSGEGGGLFGTGGLQDRAGLSSHETWTYEKDRLPKVVTKKKLDVRFRSKPGTDEMNFQQADEVLGLLAAQAKADVLRPELTAADLAAPAAGTAETAAAPDTPAAPAAPAGPSAWQAQAVSDPARLAAMRGMLTGTAKLDAALDASVFQASDGGWIVPLQISLPAAATPPGDATIVGEAIGGADGAAVLSFEATRPWEQSGNRKLVQQTLVLPPGEHTIQVGLLDPAGQALWAGKQTVTVPAPGDTSFWISDLILADEIFAMQEKQQMLEPFAWLGVAVVPKGDATFPHGSAMWFYLHTCNAGLDAEGVPAVKTMIALDGPKKFRGPAKIQPSKAGENCWILAQAMDITADQFPPGEYQIKMDVTDPASGKTLSVSKPFQVAAAPTP